jgi:iron complex outermembrane receptor protein
VSVFLSDYSDYIVAAPTGGFEDGLPAIEYQATDARFAGAELEWAHPRLAETRAGRVGARLFGDIVEAEDADGEPLPQIPPVRLGAELSLTGDRLALSVEAIWHDRQDRLADNERGTAGFTLLGADLSYRLPVATGSMLVFLRGSNLLDEEARRHASALKDYAPLTGRSIAAGLRLEF